MGKVKYVLCQQSVDGEKKNVFQVFWGLIPRLVGVDGKNVTALMGFGTESYLIVYL